MHDNTEQVSEVARRLRQLPADMTPPYGWHEFRRRADLVPPRRQPRLSWQLTTVAASVLILACALAAYLRLTHPNSARVAAAAQTDKASISSGIDADGMTAADDGSASITRSRDLEMWLSRLPQPAVVRVGTHAAVTTLEDRIAQVDDLMNSVRVEDIGKDKFAALQRERFDLVGSLAQVRYAEFVASNNP